MQIISAKKLLKKQRNSSRDTKRSLVISIRMSRTLLIRSTVIIIKNLLRNLHKSTEGRKFQRNTTDAAKIQRKSYLKFHFYESQISFK